jgi:periplasmic protein TonB
MTLRLFICLAVSVFIHALILIQPWNLLLASKPEDTHASNVAVRLVDERDLPKELFSEDEMDSEDQEEGVTFEAEGEVGPDFMDSLKLKIFRSWQYPADAVNEGLEGVVKVAFTLDRAGAVVGMEIIRSSGSRSLDEAAMDAVRRASPFGRFYVEGGESTLKITGNFCYVLDE